MGTIVVHILELSPLILLTMIHFWSILLKLTLFRVLRPEKFPNLHVMNLFFFLLGEQYFYYTACLHFSFYRRTFPPTINYILSLKDHPLRPLRPKMTLQILSLIAPITIPHSEISNKADKASSINTQLRLRLYSSFIPTISPRLVIIDILLWQWFPPPVIDRGGGGGEDLIVWCSGVSLYIHQHLYWFFDVNVGVL